MQLRVLGVPVTVRDEIPRDQRERLWRVLNSMSPNDALGLATAASLIVESWDKEAMAAIGVEGEPTDLTTYDEVDVRFLHDLYRQVTNLWFVLAESVTFGPVPLWRKAPGLMQTLFDAGQGNLHALVEASSSLIASWPFAGSPAHARSYDALGPYELWSLSRQVALYWTNKLDEAQAWMGQAALQYHQRFPLRDNADLITLYRGMTPGDLRTGVAVARRMVERWALAGDPKEARSYEDLDLFQMWGIYEAVYAYWRKRAYSDPKASVPDSPGA